MKRISLTAAVAGLVLAACASSPKEAAPAAAASSPAPAAETLVPAVNVVPESGLGPQRLEKNECALFLWSKTDPSQFIFFERAQSGTATIRIGAENVEASQTANYGQIFGEFMTEQAFAASDGTTVAISLVPGDELQGGQRVEQGSMVITTGEGWRTLIPVLGVRACQA